MRRNYQPQSEPLETRALLALFPGNPLQETPTSIIMGSGSTGANSAAAALNSFDVAIGGSSNKTAAPQSGGFRSITWDGVKLDGTDFGGPPNTQVINQNQTVIIPKNRFIGQGVFFGDPYAVSGDGFADVNPSVAGLFPAFSVPNTFAMTNSNTIDLSFNLPTGNTSSAVPAATKGFGAIFINSELANTSSIQYFSGDRSLGTFFVPTGPQGQPEFLGVLFPDAVVTRVTLTLGTDTLFTYDGVTAAPGPNANNPAGGHNLVVTDDFDYAEPVALNSDPPIVSGAQGTLNANPAVNAVVGTSFTGIVATFSDTAATLPGPTAYVANINWGDGHNTNGLITKNNRGGFDVTGTNTFSFAGRIPISVDVEKFDSTGTSISLTNTAVVSAASTTTKLSVSATSSTFTKPITLTAVVTASGATPGGIVTFQDGTNVIGTGTLDSTGTATFTTNNLLPGTHNLTATYTGNGSFNASSASNTVTESVSSNVTSLVQIIAFKAKKAGKNFKQTLVLRNIGGNPIPGPVFFVLAGLPSKVKLVNQTGMTSLIPPSPFVILPLGPAGTFANGQAIILNLTFSTNSAKKIVYSNLVLAGIPQP